MQMFEGCRGDRRLDRARPCPGC